MNRLLLSLAIAIAPMAAQAQQHPSIFLTKTEARAIRDAAPKYPLLAKSIDEAKAVVAAGMAHSIEVPQTGEAGGYAHERHKQNYREMQAAGELWQITGDEKYPRFVRDMLEKYAVLYPTLGAHPLAKNQAPASCSTSRSTRRTGSSQRRSRTTASTIGSSPRNVRFEANVFRPWPIGCR